MPAKLKDINISLISLVKKGANQRTVIFKSSDDETNYERTVKIEKVQKDAEGKSEVYGIVYPAGDSSTPDSQGDYAPADEVKKAAYGLMRNLSTTQIVDKGHDLNPVSDVYLAQSWIIQKGDPMFPNEPEGSWAVCIKVENEEIAAQIEKGELQAFSMFGTATRVPDETPAENAVAKAFQPIADLFTKLFKNHNMNSSTGEPVEVIKDFNALLNKQTAMNYAYYFEGTIRTIFNDENISDKKAARLTSIDQMKTAFEKIDLAKSELAKEDVWSDGKVVISKAGKTISDATMKKIMAAMEALKPLVESENNQTKKEDKPLEKSEKEKFEAEIAQLKKEKEDLEKSVKDKDAEIEKVKKSGSEQGEEVPETVVKSAGHIGWIS